MPQKNKLVLIDGHALAYRAFYALPADMKTSQGELTNAVFGFTSMLLNVLRDEQPAYVAVTFDKGRTFRHDIYPEYKATAPRCPTRCAPRWPASARWWRRWAYPIFEQEGYEADDLLGTLAAPGGRAGRGYAHRHRRHGPPATGGRARRTCSPPAGASPTRCVYDADGVERRYGLTRRQLVDLKAVDGRQVRQHPRRARRRRERPPPSLLQQYGSLEASTITWMRCRPAFATSWTRGGSRPTSAATWRPSFATRRCTLDLDACRAHSFDREQALELFRSSSSARWSSACRGRSAAAPPGAPHQLSLFGAAPARCAEAPHADYQVVADEEALRQLVAQTGERAPR